MQRSLLRRLYSSTTSPSSPRRHSFLLPGILTASLISYTLGSIYPPQPIHLLFPRPAPPPPSDADSPSSLAYTRELENTLQSLPLLQQLRTSQQQQQQQQNAAEEWYETRPFTDIPKDRRVNNLTAGVLRGPGKLALRPLLRARRDEKEAVTFVHIGRALCGYDGIVHGGLLATLLDESLGRIAIRNLSEKVCVTANLNLNYKAPTKADQFVVIKTRVDDIQGRKAYVSGTVEDLQGTVLVEATATFVQPKYAKLLNSSVVLKALGEPAKRDAAATVPTTTIANPREK